MPNVNTSKSRFMSIGGRKVYKLYQHNGLFYQIIRIPRLIIYEISEEEYSYLLYRMEIAKYSPYLKPYDDIVVHYLARKYFPHSDMAKDGLDFYQLIKKANKDYCFLESLALRED